MIPYGRHKIDSADLQIVNAALASNWLSMGPMIEEFEEELSKYLESTEVVVVSSGTAALHCAYYAIDLSPGDEIITTPNTFIATVAMARQMGASIQFVDVEKTTGNIDVGLIEQKINSRTKAIVGVDFAGHPVDVEEIIKICKAHNLFFIQDASHSLGSLYKNKKIGTLADITTFSFFPTKNITTAEGGAVSTKSTKLANRIRGFSRQGVTRTRDKFINESHGEWYYEVQDFGFNYRMSEISAALGITQLSKIDIFKLQRKKIIEYYNDKFKNVDALQIPFKKNYVDPFWHLYPLRVPPQQRKDFFRFMKSKNIGVQVNYIPCFMHPVFNDEYTEKNYINSVNFYQSEISLPLHLNLKEDDLEFIVEKTLSFFQ